MEISRFVALIAVTFNFFGAVFVVIGTFRVTSDLIARLTGSSHGGFSEERVKSLGRKKAFTVSGIILVFLAVAVQLLPVVFTLRPFEIFRDDRLASAFAISFGVLLTLLVLRMTWSIGSRAEERAKRAVVKNRLERALSQNPVGRLHWTSVVESAETLIGFTRRRNEPIREFLRKLSVELNVRFPDNLKIEGE